jgi:hypothetical protein
MNMTHLHRNSEIDSIWLIQSYTRRTLTVETYEYDAFTSKFRNRFYLVDTIYLSIPTIRQTDSRYSFPLSLERQFAYPPTQYPPQSTSSFCSIASCFPPVHSALENNRATVIEYNAGPQELQYLRRHWSSRDLHPIPKATQIELRLAELLDCIERRKAGCNGRAEIAGGSRA